MNQLRVSFFKRRSVLYVLSSLAGALTGAALVWQYGRLASSAEERSSWYGKAVAAEVADLRWLDLEELALRTGGGSPCPSPIDSDSALALLTRELGRAPQEDESDRFRSALESFVLCSLDDVERIFADAGRMAAIDAVCRAYLRRAPGPVERLRYGHWLQSGMTIEAVSRDLMASPAYRKLARDTER